MHRCKFATGDDTGGKFCHQFPLCCWHRPPVSTTPVANCHRCQRHLRQICHRCHWHRCQIIGTISGCRHLKVNLKAKTYKYVSSATQRWPNKIIKIFLIEDVFHLPPVSLTPVANLELRISPRIFEKIRNGLYRILWGWGGNWFMKRTRSKKSRDTVPLISSDEHHNQKIFYCHKYYWGGWRGNFFLKEIIFINKCKFWKCLRRNTV